MSTKANSPRQGLGTRHRLIELPQRRDARGSLGFAEEGRHIPFSVRRFFYLYGVPDGGARGGHAHREQHQLLIALHGRFRVVLDEGHARTTLDLSSPDTALYVPPLVWLELSDFNGHAVCAVLTSDFYDEADYIRDYEAFRVAVSGAHPSLGKP